MNLGYRWRFTTPFSVGVGLLTGAAIVTEDYRDSPTRKDYDPLTHFFAMLELTIGFEK